MPYTPLQKLEIRCQKLERLYDEQFILIENYKEFCFSSKEPSIRLLFKLKEEFTSRVQDICQNIEKFIRVCEKISHKIANKNVQHVSTGIETNELKKYRKAILVNIGYSDWVTFKHNKQPTVNKSKKCYEQDIWQYLKMMVMKGADESILEQKCEFIFDEEKLHGFLNANGMSVKNFVFYKYPTKEQVERRKHIDVQGESNPYKNAEKSRNVQKIDDDSSDSSDVMSTKKPKDNEKDRKKKDEKDRKKEKKKKKEAELRAKEKSEKEKKRAKEQLAKQDIKPRGKLLDDSSSSSDDAIIGKDVKPTGDSNPKQASSSESDSDIEMSKASASKHVKKTKPIGINMDDTDSSDDEIDQKPKKASLPPKAQPNLQNMSSSDDDFTGPVRHQAVEKQEAKTLSKPASEKIKKEKKKKKNKDKERKSSHEEPSKKPKKFKSSMNFSSESSLDDFVSKPSKTIKKEKKPEKMKTSKPLIPKSKPPKSPGLFTCYSCSKEHKINPKTGPFRHKNMFVEYKTACCRSCLEFLSDPNWTLGEDNKSDYCVISGQGGDILSCDTKECKNSFTLDALRTWMGAEKVNELEEDEDLPFFCFSCKPELGYYKVFMEKTARWCKQLEEYKVKLEQFKKHEKEKALEALKPKVEKKSKVKMMSDSSDSDMKIEKPHKEEVGPVGLPKHELLKEEIPDPKPSENILVRAEPNTISGEDVKPAENLPKVDEQKSLETFKNSDEQTKNTNDDKTVTDKKSKSPQAMNISSSSDDEPPQKKINMDEKSDNSAEVLADTPNIDKISDKQPEKMDKKEIADLEKTTESTVYSSDSSTDSEDENKTKSVETKDTPKNPISQPEADILASSSSDDDV